MPSLLVSNTNWEACLPNTSIGAEETKQCCRMISFFFIEEFVYSFWWDLEFLLGNSVDQWLIWALEIGGLLASYKALLWHNNLNDCGFVWDIRRIQQGLRVRVQLIHCVWQADDEVKVALIAGEECVWWGRSQRTDVKKKKKSQRKPGRNTRRTEVLQYCPQHQLPQ